MSWPVVIIGGLSLIENLSVVITTYNRPTLLKRALGSLASNKAINDIIVVDDCSSDAITPQALAEFKNLRYFINDNNYGPNYGRNLGINKAVNNYVILLDDDDILLPNADKAILNILNHDTALQKYPVVNFTIDSPSSPKTSSVATINDLIENDYGDLTHVVNQHYFSKMQLAFPSLKIGAENLLWYEIGRRVGLPIVATPIRHMFEDAKQRLTDYSQQVKNADLFADYYHQLFECFGDDFKRHPKAYLKRYRGLVSYHLLANFKAKARQLIKHAPFSKLEKLLFGLVSYLPVIIIQRIFLLARKLS